MAETIKKPILNPADILKQSAPDWAKGGRPWQKIVGDSQVIYEDSHVVSFHDPDDDPREAERTSGELRVTLICKKDVQSLMDLSVGDENLNEKILHGIQQTAYRLGLEKKGFEVRAHVLPPLQRRPELSFKIRSGKAPKKGDTAAG
jgi:hypothetical protein